MPSWAHRRSRAAPGWRLLAQRREWEGACLLRLTVGVDGRVVAVSLMRSSGHDVLDEAALKSARGWRFRPGTRGGRAVAMDVVERVLFDLDGV